MPEPTEKSSRDSLDYSIVTELPGDRITREAMSMLHTRYAFAKRFCMAKDVLELACGPGLGLAYLARYARSVVGGDHNFVLLRDASTGCCRRLPLMCLDAHALPFRERSFDVVLLYEAIYYLDQPEQFICECKRVLRAGGLLIVCLPNRDWPGFHPSPLSKRYFSASELYSLFVAHGFDVEVLGGFLSKPSTIGQKVRDFVRRIAVRYQLIPVTLKSKAILKRFFYGRLYAIGRELTDDELRMDPLFPISQGENNSNYRIFYALARTSAKA